MEFIGVKLQLLAPLIEVTILDTGGGKWDLYTTENWKVRAKQYKTRNELDSPLLIDA